MAELTTTEAVQTYRVSLNLLQRWILQGDVEARKVDGHWLISKDSLEKRNRKRVAYGKPKLSTCANRVAHAATEVRV